MKKIKVGVLGATGAVGTEYVRLLSNHPWFELSVVAASSKSAGKNYGEAASEKWVKGSIPKNVKDMRVENVSDIELIASGCGLVFSAFEGSKEEIQAIENQYAMLVPVVSNNSAHRWSRAIPMIMPEINAGHLDIIKRQKEIYGFEKGFIVVKPNCSIQSFLMQIHALRNAGYHPNLAIVTTSQALSGAGIPGVPSMKITDNIIPYIKGEEEKTEEEPKKIFGHVENWDIVPYEELRISATCTRVPVRYGHTASVSLFFKSKLPDDLDEIIRIWERFQPEDVIGLPSAPEQPLFYVDEEDGPQPARELAHSDGMTVFTGRLKKGHAPELGMDFLRFVGLSDNIIRGAAGGAILTAELLKKKEYLD
jgi:aspartate-semialdehyde dehydrogenase